MEKQPIVFIDADDDDHTLFKKALAELGFTYPILVFADGQAALDYLITTEDVPFLIISEISLPGLTGLELRQQIDQDPQLRRKCIPFIFITHPVEDHLVEEAYELTIQGFFEKKPTFNSWKHQLGAIIAYWSECDYPKRSTR